MSTKTAVTFDSIQEALAEPNFTLGTDALIRCKGHSTPGDGGGGIFTVNESGAATDGGAVFAFDTDLSSQQTEGISGYGYSLSNTDLVWGEVSIRYASGSTNGRENVLPHKDMHGHTSGLMSNGVAGWIDYKNGDISGPGNTLKNMNIDYGDGSKTYTVRYKHATSNRRLERVGVTNAVNIDWWGATQADANNPVSAETELKYALNKAKNLYDSSNYDWVYLDIPGEYYFNLHVRIPDGVMIRGTGPDRNVPNRSFTVNGALTYMPGEALYYKHQDYDRAAENDVYGYMRNQQTHFGNMEAASDKMGLYNIELNGNLKNNEEVITSGEYPGIEQYLQNSGDWNAFYTRGKGGESYEKGYPFYAENVYAHSYGANSFAGGGGQASTMREPHLK